MRIKETLCRLCRGEKTTFGLVYYQDILPICDLCISSIKELEGSDKKDETTSTDCLDKLTRLEKSYQKEIAELKDTHKKDYPNVALSEKLMTGLTEKQYDKAVKE